MCPDIPKSTYIHGSTPLLTLVVNRVLHWRRVPNSVVVQGREEGVGERPGSDLWRYLAGQLYYFAAAAQNNTKRRFKFM